MEIRERAIIVLPCDCKPNRKKKLEAGYMLKTKDGETPHFRIKSRKKKDKNKWLCLNCGKLKEVIK